MELRVYHAHGETSIGELRIILWGAEGGGEGAGELRRQHCVAVGGIAKCKMQNAKCKMGSSPYNRGQPGLTQ